MLLDIDNQNNNGKYRILTNSYVSEQNKGLNKKNEELLFVRPKSHLRTRITYPVFPLKNILLKQ